MTKERIVRMLVLCIVCWIPCELLHADDIDDRVIVLMGDRARVGDGIVYAKGNDSPEYGFQAKAPKRRFMHGWDHTNYYEWIINAPDQNDITVTLRPGQYQVELLAEADGSIVTATIWQKQHTISSITHTFAGAGYQVNDLIDNWVREPFAGLLTIPEGPCRLQLTKTGEAVKFRSLELVHRDDLALVRAEVDRLRGSVGWLYESRWNRPPQYNSKYGLKLQWGRHCVQADGTKRYTDWEEQVRAFDVQKFAGMVERTGAEVVIFQISRSENGGEHNWYYYPGPCTVIDSIVGDRSRTAERDLMLEMAVALLALEHPVKLMFYYHLGHDQMVDSPWWPKNWRNQDNKKVMFKNWCRIFQEIGARYGDKLAGILFDDGMIYYPAPFHELAVAAKTGFQERLIGYNSFNAAPRLTEYQDLYYGEEQMGITHLDHLFAKTDSGRQTGLFTAGPLQGLQYEGHFKFGTDAWSCDAAHYTYKHTHSPLELFTIVSEGLKRRQLIILGPLITEDGSFLPEALEEMERLHQRLLQR